MPYPVGTTPEVLQTYCGPGSHSRDNQLAYDFRTEFGTPVVAARAGVVSTVVDGWPDSDKDDAHFNYILITHADSTFAFYAHLKHESFVVAPGDSVAQGQVVAAAGESGTPTFCAFEVCGVLHFGVYSQSWRIDLPVNFRNADGPLDDRGGLVTGTFYTVTMALIRLQHRNQVYSQHPAGRQVGARHRNREKQAADAEEGEEVEGADAKEE